MDLTIRLGWGLLWSALIAGFALYRGSLSRSGAAAALAIGSAIYLGGGGPWFLSLLTFFVTSTVLGKVGRAKKAEIKREFEKGDTRDALQAFSNGGVAAACAIMMFVWPSKLWAAAFVGALATANGDTWATELGVLSRGEPWSVLTLRRAPRGTSGAISPLGIAATLFGGLAVGISAALAPDAFSMRAISLVMLGGVAGVFGSLVDSVLGATLQSSFYCSTCQRDTEGPTHHCGTRTEHRRGLCWFNNDVVNLTATLSGALLGASWVW